MVSRSKTTPETGKVASVNGETKKPVKVIPRDKVRTVSKKIATDNAELLRRLK